MRKFVFGICLLIAIAFFYSHLKAATKVPRLSPSDPLSEVVNRTVPIRISYGGFGHGLIIGPGKVLTNLHICSEPMTDIGGYSDYQVLKTDRRLDVCLIAVPGIGIGLREYTIGDYKSPKVGEAVYSLRYRNNSIKDAKLRVAETLTQLGSGSTGFEDSGDKSPGISGQPVFVLRNGIIYFAGIHYCEVFPEIRGVRYNNLSRACGTNGEAVLGFLLRKL